MTIKTVCKLLAFYTAIFVIGTILFVFSFQTPLFVHMQVFFYRGIGLLCAVSIGLSMILIFLKQAQKITFFTYRDVCISILALFSANLLFFTHVPVTADRSISIFMLGYVRNHSSGPVTKEEITEAFIETYVYTYDELDKRIEEQLVSGNIVGEGVGYRLTTQGQRVMRFYSVIADMFGINKRIISP